MLVACALSRTVIFAVVVDTMTVFLSIWLLLLFVLVNVVNLDRRARVVVPAEDTEVLVVCATAIFSVYLFLINVVVHIFAFAVAVVVWLVVFVGVFVVIFAWCAS